ncbi:MAG: rod shape-determining protein MreD, partial [Eubacteriales bacterium]|nr:rod shape-determining protein MreD [Eubacteriales bacterium]
MRRKAGELLLILIFYLLQVSLGRVIAIADIVPNFLIILPVLFGFFNGKNEGMFVGFFAGVMYDIFFSGLFGFSSLVYIY